MTFSSSFEGSDLPCRSNSECHGSVDGVKEICKNGKCQTSKKKNRMWMLLFTLLFLLMAGGVVWYSRWYNKWVHKNRRNAQVGGALTEFSMLSDMLNSKN